jgi:hypothetical protein
MALALHLIKIFLLDLGRTNLKISLTAAKQLPGIPVLLQTSVAKNRPNAFDPTLTALSFPEFVLTSKFVCSCHLLHHSTRLFWVALHALLIVTLSFTVETIIIIPVYIKILIRLSVSTFTSHHLFYRGMSIGPGL